MDGQDCWSTLEALVECGPLWDGDVPSKKERDVLVNGGLAVHVLVDGKDGYTAATYRGRDAYKEKYGGETIAAAIANRRLRSAAARYAAEEQAKGTA